MHTDTPQEKIGRSFSLLPVPLRGTTPLLAQAMVLHKHLDPELCVSLIRDAERCSEFRGGWRTKRHNSYPSTDLDMFNDFPAYVSVHLLKQLLHVQATVKQFYKIPAALHMCIKDLFIARYSCDAQAGFDQEARKKPVFIHRQVYDKYRINCSAHPGSSQQIIQDCFESVLLNVIQPFGFRFSGVEWWCNFNKTLDWHFDKDETLVIRQQQLSLPLFSTVYYPRVNCHEGELLLHDPACDGARLLSRIPPRAYRLVLFSPGILHKINDFAGVRYSLAMNIWEKPPCLFRSN
jgi:hypothetical protein